MVLLNLRKSYLNVKIHKKYKDVLNCGYGRSKLTYVASYKAASLILKLNINISIQKVSKVQIKENQQKISIWL